MHVLSIESLCSCTSPILFLNREIERTEVLHVKARQNQVDDITSWCNQKGFTMTKEDEYLVISR